MDTIPSGASLTPVWSAVSAVAVGRVGLLRVQAGHLHGYGLALPIMPEGISIDWTLRDRLFFLRRDLLGKGSKPSG